MDASVWLLVHYVPRLASLLQQVSVKQLLGSVYIPIVYYLPFQDQFDQANGRAVSTWEHLSNLKWWPQQRRGRPRLSFGPATCRIVIGST